MTYYNNCYNGYGGSGYNNAYQNGQAYSAGNTLFIYGTNRSDNIQFRQNEFSVDGGASWNNIPGQTSRIVVNGRNGQDVIDARNLSMYNQHGQLLTLEAHGGRGNDTIIGSRGINYLYGGNGNDRIYANGWQYNYVNGGRGNDYIVGGPGYNHLDGGRGNDVLVGRWNDSLHGGPGYDRIYRWNGYGYGYQNDCLSYYNMGGYSSQYGGAGYHYNCSNPYWWNQSYNPAAA